MRPSRAPDAADLVLEKLSTQAAVALIATLPRLQAEVILLRVVAGLDTQTVARLVGRARSGPGRRPPWFTAAGRDPGLGVTHGSAP
jgi:hypothetical protein